MPSQNLIDAVYYKYPRSIDFIMHTCGTRNIAIHKKIGSGSFGEVYAMSATIGDSKKYYIIKLQKLRYPPRSDPNFGRVREFYAKSHDYEYRMHVLFHQLQLGAPNPIGRYLFDEISVGDRNQIPYDLMIMEAEAYSLDVGMMSALLSDPQPIEVLQLVITVITSLIGEFAQHNITHGDFHWGNFGLRDATATETHLPTFKLARHGRMYRLSPFLIDFGMAQSVNATPSLEITQLMRTLFPAFKIVHKNNRKYLYSELYKLLMQYAPNLRRAIPRDTDFSDADLDRIEEVFMTLFEYNRDKIRADEVKKLR